MDTVVLPSTCTHTLMCKSNRALLQGWINNYIPLCLAESHSIFCIGWFQLCIEEMVWDSVELNIQTPRLRVVCTVQSNGIIRMSCASFETRLQNSAWHIWYILIFWYSSKNFNRILLHDFLKSVPLVGQWGLMWSAFTGSVQTKSFTSSVQVVYMEACTVVLVSPSAYILRNTRLNLKLPNPLQQRSCRNVYFGYIELPADLNLKNLFWNYFLLKEQSQWNYSMY